MKLVSFGEENLVTEFGVDEEHEGEEQRKNEAILEQKPCLILKLPGHFQIAVWRRLGPVRSCHGVNEAHAFWTGWEYLRKCHSDKLIHLIHLNNYFII